MTLCHMIRPHGDTNGISQNERPAVWPPLVHHIPVYPPPPLPLFSHARLLQLVSDTFPPLAFVCSISLIDLLEIAVDRRAATIRPTHLPNWMAPHYSWQVTHSVINIPDISQYYHDWSQLAAPD